MQTTVRTLQEQKIKSIKKQQRNEQKLSQRKHTYGQKVIKNAL